MKTQWKECELNYFYLNLILRDELYTQFVVTACVSLRIKKRAQKTTWKQEKSEDKWDEEGWRMFFNTLILHAHSSLNAIQVFLISASWIGLGHPLLQFIVCNTRVNFMLALNCKNFPLLYLFAALPQILSYFVLIEFQIFAFSSPYTSSSFISLIHMDPFDQKRR